MAQLSIKHDIKLTKIKLKWFIINYKGNYKINLVLNYKSKK